MAPACKKYEATRAIHIRCFVAVPPVSIKVTLACHGENDIQRRFKSAWLSSSGTSCGEKGVVDAIFSSVNNNCCRRSYQQMVVPFS